MWYIIICMFFLIQHDFKHKAMQTAYIFFRVKNKMTLNQTHYHDEENTRSN